MSDFYEWEKIEPAIGEGGQGRVYKARSPRRAWDVQQSITKIVHELRQLNGIGTIKPKQIEDLLKRMADVGGPDKPEDLGALKVLKMPTDSSEINKARLRLVQETTALEANSHPSLLKLLYSSLDPGKEVLVTEYHPGGTLDDESNLTRFKGRALEALLAFRPVVEAVSMIHVKGAIHRDIKLKNIFVATDGRLVLGDFGIVIFLDAHNRVTETYERVGSRDWMAPWANTGHRLTLEDVNPTLDIFPLGKILWCMIAGRNNLALWYYSRPANNLEMLFPHDSAMSTVNEVLAKCVVEDEDKCLKSAAELLQVVDEAIASLSLSSGRPAAGKPWRCQYCGKGHYSEGMPLAPHLGVSSVLGKMKLCICNNCRHIQWFISSS